MQSLKLFIVNSVFIDYKDSQTASETCGNGVKNYPEKEPEEPGTLSHTDYLRLQKNW